ncbi:MAG TPA: alpha/beta fold hydrolase [Chloroflexia bacterium]|nr:alpha/beta fold hydrolase [Chloroflexia bacterium]
MGKPPLILLHGALGAREQFAPLVPLLAGHLDVHCLDFNGHGGAPLRGDSFRIADFAQDVLDYLDQREIAEAALFGYSMGGYVACTLAAAQPARVTRVMTFGTKFYWDRDVAEREGARLDPVVIRAKVPHFAQALAARHTATGWEAVLALTRALLLDLGAVGGLRAPDVAGLQQPVRIARGDRDRTVTLAETEEMYQALPHGELEVLPATPHEFERVSAARLAASLSAFCVGA